MDARSLPFTLRQLQYALAVAETRNFRRAAERCAVAQPSLSAQLAALEAALGARLFERGRGGVLPTPAGEALLGRMRALLAGARDLAQQASTFRDPLAGPLRLGVIPTLGPYLLPALAPRLKRGFPGLQPLWREAQTSTLVAALGRGELEAAILAREAELGDLEMAELGWDPFLLCLPKGHPLARRRGAIPLGELDRQPLLLLEDGHCLRDQALAACGRDRPEDLGYRATSLATLVQLVAGGAGLTLLPRLAVDVETPRAAVLLRPLAAPAPGRTLVLAWRRGSYADGALRRLAQGLRSALAGRVDDLGF